MISRIEGKIRDKKPSTLLIDVNGLSYEVVVPQMIMKEIDAHIKEDGFISLVTYHYHQVEPSRSTPVLIGFLNEIEKEFFERFITVSGVGPKAAIRALSMPISVIAQAIDSGNLALLKSLPGIGEQRAKEIVAKLQGKVGKFGLIQDKETGQPKPEKENYEQEAMEVLLQLQYKRQEANEMIKKALSQNLAIKTTEELLNEVYRQRIKDPHAAKVKNSEH
ncbi:MAG: Holliday junction branch migration protein RuvA [Candidatus Omnitrophota bacterium]